MDDDDGEKGKSLGTDECDPEAWKSRGLNTKLGKEGAPLVAKLQLKSSCSMAFHQFWHPLYHFIAYPSNLMQSLVMQVHVQSPCYASTPNHTTIIITTTTTTTPPYTKHEIKRGHTFPFFIGNRYVMCVEAFNQ